jgi:hypothetical protein
VEETLSPSQVYGPIFEDDPILGEPLLPLIAKTQLRFVESREEMKPANPDPLLARFHLQAKKTVSSDTGELLWDYGKGIFSIDTRRTQAAVGFLGNKKMALKNISLSVKSPSFVSFCLSSLTEEPISSSKKLLLSVASRIENTGQRFNAVKTQLKAVGASPVLIEGVSAKVLLIGRQKPKPQAQVYALDMNGNRIKSIPCQRLDSSLGFTVSPFDKALFYEIVLE